MRWSDKALGREVIEARIEYHLQRRDFQTAATILCIVDPPKSRATTKTAAAVKRCSSNRLSRVPTLPPPTSRRDG